MKPLSKGSTDIVTSFKSGVKFLEPSGEASVITPTSDRANISRVEFINELSIHVTPNAINKASLKAYTTYKVLRKRGVTPAVPGALPDGLSPSSMKAVYGVSSNGSGAIAIVDAYSYPQADADLAQFSTTFHLPPCRENKADETKGCLQKFPQDAARHESVAGFNVNCGWAGEAALDLEWAHAIAPGAKLIFVQAKSSNLDDLLTGVRTAVAAVKAAGGGQISMSWIGSESLDELSSDSTFADGLLYFASSGDVGGSMGYPAASPKVISVGGTGLLWDSGRHFAGEYGWAGSGGGESGFESLPSYQSGILNVIGTHRNVPDISADADPNTGAAVYVSTPVGGCVDRPTPDQYQAGWQVVGGTSLASPMVAAMVNAAGRHRTTVLSELRAIYSNRGNPARIRDITEMVGSAGANTTKVGYDNVTGVGAPASADFDADP
jgi:subtilase family serine protease